MNKKILFLLAPILAMSYLLGSMRAINLPQESLDSAQIFSPSERGVHINSKIYHSEESRLFLGHDYIGKGVVPLELSIRNSSGHTYEISAASVPLALYRGKDMAWKQTKKSIPRSLAMRIASLFFWPLMIPATIDGIVTLKRHISLSKDLEAKTLKEKDEPVPPYSTVTRILYVKEKSYQPEFSVSLQDVDSKELMVVRTSAESNL